MTQYLLTMSLTKNSFHLILLFTLTRFFQGVHTQWYRSVYQMIQQDLELSGFNSLVKSNRLAQQYLNYNELTVFVPDNEAFRKYKGEIIEDMVLYHMTFEMKSLQNLNTTTNSLTTVHQAYPPLWISRSRGEIYVNNAKIIQSQSNLSSRIKHEEFGKQQIFHTIDEVLNPMILSERFSPNAFDFLSKYFKWNLPGETSVSKFFVKVQENKLQNVFKGNVGHTFFIPIDTGIDSHNLALFDKHVIKGHIVPFYVLFTSPTEKNFAYETMSKEVFSYTVLSFIEINGKLFVKSRRQNEQTGNKEEYFSEIILSNIPVKNGVIHLISKPLMNNSYNSLTLFPNLPVLTKISTDPELTVFYEMGEETKFNKIFNVKGVQFTYFVPRDTAWHQATKQQLNFTEDHLHILKRHLIVSDTPYFIEHLESMTRANNYSYVQLNSEEGPLKIGIIKIDNDYYINWYNKCILILRPNYECTNGIIHIIAGPMLEFKHNYNQNYWEAFKQVLKKAVKR